MHSSMENDIPLQVSFYRSVRISRHWLKTFGQAHVGWLICRELCKLAPVSQPAFLQLLASRWIIHLCQSESKSRIPSDLDR